MRRLDLIACLQPITLEVDCSTLDIGIGDGHFGFYKQLEIQARGDSRKDNLLYIDLVITF
tara:strand:- start:1221 stop:1400 length:180 start_codon:yes stop_codon:yes gene_type:complete